MTWLYVPSASVTDMEDSSLDSEQSECQYEPWLVLSGTATRRPFSWRGWKNRGWIDLLSGTISNPSMAARGVAEWISSLPVSRASRSVLPDRDVVLRMTGGSGLPSDGSFVTWDRDGCSWRTSPDLFDTGYLTSSPTLPTSGSMRNGVCSPRPKLVPLIGGRDFGSWHTPTTTHGAGGGRNNRGEPTLPTQAKMWATPRALDGMSGGDKASSHPQSGGDGLQTAATLHSLTTSTDGNDGSPAADLNPRFVAALMGLPWDWLTPYISEATDSCRPAPHTHSRNS